MSTLRYTQGVFVQYPQPLRKVLRKKVTGASHHEALSATSTASNINLLAFSNRYSFATCVLERAVAAVMESRTTGPQIPHWSELPLQRDTKRWQPPLEEKQVNIKLSDCLLLPAARLHGCMAGCDSQPQRCTGSHPSRRHSLNQPLLVKFCSLPFNSIKSLSQ